MRLAEFSNGIFDVKNRLIVIKKTVTHGHENFKAKEGSGLTMISGLGGPSTKPTSSTRESFGGKRVPMNASAVEEIVHLTKKRKNVLRFGTCHQAHSERVIKQIGNFRRIQQISRIFPKQYNIFEMQCAVPPSAQGQGPIKPK